MSSFQPTDDRHCAGEADPADRVPVVTRLRLHAGTVLSFLLGGVAGVLTWLPVGDQSFAIAGLLLALIATVSIGGATELNKPQAGPVDP